MAGLGDLFQKAVYLGVGLASYTGEKASERLGELRSQAQKLADELVQRGEMTTEEARKMVDDMVQRSQAEAASIRSRVESGQAGAPSSTATSAQNGPRTIEIEVEDSSGQTTATTATTTADATKAATADALRSEVEKLQAELQRLKRGA